MRMAHFIAARFAVFLAVGLVCGWAPGSVRPALASPPVVPGTGNPIPGVGDDFEDPEWEYIYNLPKSSGEQDGRRRTPFGGARNGRWAEGDGRGQPDLVRRIPTPEGGLPGSEGALLIATRITGIPDAVTHEAHQDDLFLLISGRVGAISPSRSPSAVVRVFVPPLEEWEDRSGSHFAFRATLRGVKPGERKTEPYWPGLFFQFQDGSTRKDKRDSAYLLVRAGERGQDYGIRPITQTGWWTLGMSFTGDGRVHYYARPGIEDLTESDYLVSHYCYGFRAAQLKQVFFDIWNRSDGQAWSTGWVIDDPTIYVTGPPPGLAQQPPKSKPAVKR